MNYIELDIEKQLNNEQAPKAFSNIYRINKKSRVPYWIAGIFGGLALILFIPWTQNIRASGTVTTIRLEQRPQQLNSVIPGKITRWYVKEGDFVHAGDTLMQLSEIKEDYLDPDLLDRTREQLSAKEKSISDYKSKAGAADGQMQALEESRSIKLMQLENKLIQQKLKAQSDSFDMLSAYNDYAIASAQFQRQKMLYDSGLVSLTQLEQRNMVYQSAAAKKTAAEIKFMNAKQELGILKLEMNGATQDYNEKISKTSGDKFQSNAQIASGQAEISKLQNQYMNYDIRRKLYFITAPQSGQVVNAKKAGIGEIVKEGEMIAEIVPDNIQYAGEIYVRPVDLPFLENGQKMRFMFDGFPAVVFSGWPQASYGTFGGKIIAIESSMNENGKFRILAGEDSADRKWPEKLKMGTGAQGMALLREVPLWYELWRNINGFPQDYYKPDPKTKSVKKDKPA
jgi:multidrug resistance efflux pump